MAIQPCRECGRDVSTEATACPHCGARAAARRTGRYVAVAALAVLLLTAAVPLVTYGTLSPCQMLKRELIRTGLAGIDEGADGWEALGVALGGSMIDGAIEALGPMECLALLPDARREARFAAGAGPPSDVQAIRFREVVRAEVRNLQTLQDMYLSYSGRFTMSPEALGFEPAAGVVLVDLYSDGNWWAAKLGHEDWPGATCVIAAGDIPDGQRLPTTPAGKSAREMVGMPVCDR